MDEELRPTSVLQCWELLTNHRLSAILLNRQSHTCTAAANGKVPEDILSSDVVEEVAKCCPFAALPCSEML